MFIIGDVPVGATLYCPFDTYDANGGSITITGLAVTDIEIYKNGGTTQRSSDNGYTLLDTDGIDFDGATGLHGFSIDLSDNSDSGFYTAGSTYWINVNAITCDTQTVRFTYHFTIGLNLRPTTAGRTLDVSSGGEAGLDWANIGSPTTSVALSGTSVLLTNGTGTGQVSLTSGLVTLADASLTNAKLAGDTGLKPLRTGTAQAGATSTITLDAGASSATNFYSLMRLKIVGGTGVGESGIINQYNGSTKVATMARPWQATVPDNTSVFVIESGEVNVSTWGPSGAQQVVASAGGGYPSVGIRAVNNSTTAATNLGAAYDGTGYAGGTIKQQVVDGSGNPIATASALASDSFVMVDTTLAAVTTQTNLKLTAGSTDSGAYNNAMALITDASTPAQKSLVQIDLFIYSGGDRIATLKSAPAFTVAPGDRIQIFAMNAGLIYDLNNNVNGVSEMVALNTGGVAPVLVGTLVDADVLTQTVELPGGYDPWYYAYAGGVLRITGGAGAGRFFLCGQHDGSGILKVQPSLGAPGDIDNTSTFAIYPLGLADLEMIGGDFAGWTNYLNVNMLKVDVGSIGEWDTAAYNLASAFNDVAGPVPWMGIVDQGTAQSATGTTVVLRAASAFGDDTLIGDLISVFGSDQGYWQTRQITDSVLSSDTVTVAAFAVTPTGTITYKIWRDVPSTGGGGGGDATQAKQDIIIGLIGTPVTDLAADIADISGRIPAALVSGNMSVVLANVVHGGNAAILDLFAADIELFDITAGLYISNAGEGSRFPLEIDMVQNTTYAMSLNASIQLDSVDVEAALASIGGLITTVGTAGAGLTDLGGMSTSMRAQVESEAIDALQARGVTSARMGYTDNLNVGGNVASSAEVTAIQNNTRVVRVVPTVIERPDAGTQLYLIHIYLYDSAGGMEAPDSAPTLGLTDQDGTDLAARLDSPTGTGSGTGHYVWEYTASVTDDLEQLLWEFVVVEGGNTRRYGNTSLIVDTVAADFTGADRTKLEGIFNKLPSRDYLVGTAQTTGAIDAADKTSYALSTAGNLAIWHVLNSTIVTANTIGKYLLDQLANAVPTAASVATSVWAAVARTLTAATNITSTGGTTVPQTGDSFSRLGAPAGASVSADVLALSNRVPAALVGGRMDSSLGATQAGVLDTYHATVDLRVDSAKDEYSVLWFKNGVIVANADITNPRIQVVTRGGSDLVAQTSMSADGTIGLIYDESGNRITPGNSVKVVLTATIGGGARTWPVYLGRDATS